MKELQEVDLSKHEYDYRSGNPAVYVSTYHKYASGSLDGMWLDLYSFYSYEDFIYACKWIHRDETDPELMFQDYENFPEQWYDEGHLSEETFDKIQEYADLDEDEQEAFKAYLSEVDEGGDIDDFRDCYEGSYGSEEEFAEEYAEREGWFDNLSEKMKEYFDFKSFAEDLLASEYEWVDGFVFRNSY